jgi:hypothetical protein
MLDFLGTLLAAVIGGVLAAAAVVYQTRRQLRQAAASLVAAELSAQAARTGEMASQAIAAIMATRAVLAELRRLVARPGFNLHGKTERDAVAALLAQAEQAGRGLRTTPLLTTGQARLPGGRRLAATAETLVGGPAVVDRGQAAVERFVAAALAQLDDTEAALRDLV